MNVIMKENKNKILTKLSLNNKIVEMRKYVKQVRIRSINKLCKEIKKLKSSRASEEQKAKKLKKSENLVQQVLFMKKVNADDVTKFALLNVNDEHMTKVLSDTNESLKKKVLVRLACHKLIVEKIKQFEQEFCYTSDSLKLLMETLGEKYNKKKTKRPALLPSSLVPHISLKRMVTNAQDEDPLPNIEVKSSVNSVDIKDRWLDSNKTKVDNFDENNLLVQKIAIEKHTSKITERFKNIKTKGLNDETRRNIKLHAGALFRTETRGDSTESSPVPVEIKPESRVADPFFMTKDNSEYISVSTKENVFKFENNNELPKLGSHHPINKNVNNDVYKVDKCKLESNNHNGNFTKSVNKNVKLKKSNLKNIGSNDTLLPVHPSWEAKRKYRSNALNCKFEGKKIKFDE